MLNPSEPESLAPVVRSGFHADEENALGSLPAPSQPAGGTGHRPPRKQKRGWFGSALEGIARQWALILACAAIGGIAGYVYSARFCVPLYQIEASVELQNSTSNIYTETLTHILESQTLINAALSTLPEEERGSIVERPSVISWDRSEAIARLRARLRALATPAADVVDIEFVSPDRHAAVDFVNALIHGLMERMQPAATKTANASLPDEWTEGQVRPAPTIAVIDPAIASADPVAPNTLSNVGVALAAGLLFGVMMALIRRFATGTFRDPSSVGDALGVRQLGAIPERKLLTAPGTSDASAAMQIDPTDESLRFLRSSLLYHQSHQELRYLAFTSAAPGEGKTTVITNLSVSLAATGRRVLAIDGDLRRPRLHKLFQVPPGPGLADLLRRDPSGPPAILAKYVHASAFQNLYVLAPGSSGNDAPELLAGPLLPKLLRDLGKNFDFILIDTPPLLACSDARNYSRAADGVVLVVRASETQKRAALVARDLLLEDGANIVGTVLTAWRQSYPSYSYSSASNYARS